MGTDDGVLSPSEPELIEQRKGRLVQLLPNPFTIERRDLVLSEGGTISEMMARAGCRPGLSYLVMVDDRVIPREWWARSRPKQGTTLTIRAVPMGGGDNSNDSNKTLRTVLLIVIAVVAIAVAAYVPGAWGVVLGAVISIGGSLAILDLLPSPRALEVQHALP